MEKEKRAFRPERKEKGCMIFRLWEKKKQILGLERGRKPEKEHRTGRRKGRKAICTYRNQVLASFMLTFCFGQTVLASNGAAIVNQGFDVIFTIIAAIVSSVGTLLLLWGIFEWAQALNTQDGAAQSMAFKRIASGLVAMIGPQLVPIISASVNVAS